MNYNPNHSFAAVDLGSNSFHMIVANFEEGRIQVIDRLKEMVRLASGLDSKQRLSDESINLALSCLHRFGERIKEIPRTNIRAVGTNTLRQARNSQKFLTAARNALGHPIETIAGREEARLIYLGVAHFAYNKKKLRLVVDIGGGSTELIIGRGFDTNLTESLYMGCVNTSQNFFTRGEITDKKMKKAVMFAQQELEPLESVYKKAGWDETVGSSGTIRAVYDVVLANKWSQNGITPESLELLRKYLIKCGHIEHIQLEGVSDERKPVFTGGVAVLSGIFEALKIDLMTVSDGSLREGILYDLIGRIHDDDIRDKTIEDFTQRYNLDREQTGKIINCVSDMYQQVKRPWHLGKPDLKLLKWAASVHEIGLSIAHTQYHKHGAYLMSNSDMPGFSRQEQLNLAMLVRAHRRRFPEIELNELPFEEREKIKRLCILLRVAVLLNRSRSYSENTDVKLIVDNESMRVRFPKSWLDNHPLTLIDLETEADYLARVGFELRYY